ncbi:MAG TPA: ribosome-associated translation inhibitor RaiA [Candidatus Saccharimonadales bacterium]|nr:ribosome-associated translation inhibitor RaiA [Candidatus Saccharimonadales bacterium]
MISKVEINGVHTKLDAKTQEYALEKIGKVDKYLPRHARASAHVEVKLIKEKIRAREIFTCEVVLFLPHSVVTSKESAPSFMVAIDLVEGKLKNQLKKYKGRHSRDRLHHRVLSKILRNR